MGSGRNGVKYLRKLLVMGLLLQAVVLLILGFVQALHERVDDVLPGWHNTCPVVARNDVVTHSVSAGN